MIDTEHVHEASNELKQQLTTPAVALLHNEVARRRRRRRQVAGVAMALALVIGGVGAWALTNQSTANETATAAADVDDGSARPTTTIATPGSNNTPENPIEPGTDSELDGVDVTDQIATTQQPNSLRDLLVTTLRWSPIARTNIPEAISSPTDGEFVYFDQTEDGDYTISFSSCRGTPYIIDWQADGFIATGPVGPPQTATAECTDQQKGVELTPVVFDELVNVTIDEDGTATLAASAWSLHLEPAAFLPPISEG